MSGEITQLKAAIPMCPRSMKTNTFDCSAVINVHREGVLLVPTLRSIGLAKSEAEKYGGRVEVMIVADNPDERTLEICRAWGEATDIKIVDERDLGRAREHGIRSASSRWVFLHDGDDLFSSNIYSEFIRLLKGDAIRERQVYHLEYFIKFGGENEIRRIIPSDDPSFDPLFLVYDWFYSNKCVIDKTLLDVFPIPHNDKITGLGNEDWSWAGDTIASGIVHAILPNTACFYRVKEAHLSLGLVPSMTQRASKLYSQEYINGGARRQNASRMLVDEPDFITQIQLPKVVYDLMDEQAVLEPLISANRRRNPWAVNSYLRSMLRRSADGAASFLGRLDHRKKLIIFLSDRYSTVGPRFVEMLKDIQGTYSPESHQIILIHETDRDVFSHLDLADEWGTLYLTTRRMKSEFATPEWFFSRLPLRAIVQHPGCTIVDTGSQIFRALCKDFYKVVVSQSKRIIMARCEVVEDAILGLRQKAHDVRGLLSRSPLYDEKKVHILDVFGSSQGGIGNNLRISANTELAEFIFLNLTVKAPAIKDVAADWALIRPGQAVSRNLIVEHDKEEKSESLYVEAGGVLSPRFVVAAVLEARKLNRNVIVIPQTIQHYDPATEEFYFRWYDFSDPSAVVAELFDRSSRGHLVGLAAVVCGSEIVEKYKGCGDLMGLLDDEARSFGEPVIITVGGEAGGISLVVTSSKHENAIDANAYPAFFSSTRGRSQVGEQLLERYGVAFCASDYLSSFRHSRSMEEIKAYCQQWREDRPDVAAVVAPPSEALLLRQLSEEAQAWAQNIWMPVYRYFSEPASNGEDKRRSIRKAAEEASLLESSFEDMLAILQVREDTFFPPSSLRDIRWRGPEFTNRAHVLKKLREMGSALEGGHFVLLPFLESGGAELVGTMHLRAWKKFGLVSPRIILTEGEQIVANYEEFSSDTINLPQMISGITGMAYPGEFSLEDRKIFLRTFLDAARPSRIFCVQSYTGSLVLSHYKPSAVVEFAMFCPHIDEEGRVSGFQNVIPAVDDHVDLYLCDNTRFASEIVETYGIGPDRVRTLFYPPDVKRVSAIDPQFRSDHRSRHVLWASRIDHQKNPEMLANIARAMPDMTFHMYGRRVMLDSEFDIGELPINVRFHGQFSSLAELIVRNYLCFLYTSRFDGMPNMLLEVAAAGLPVVTPNVGGISDFFGADWIGYIPGEGGVEDYVQAIRSVAMEQNHKLMLQKQEAALSSRSLDNLEDCLRSMLSEQVSGTPLDTGKYRAG